MSEKEEERKRIKSQDPPLSYGTGAGGLMVLAGGIVAIYLRHLLAHR